MASISTDKNGNRTIQFTAADKCRRSIRLGKTPMKFVRTVKAHVEVLAAAAITGDTVDPNTSKWLRDRDAVILDKLAAVGLFAKRDTIMLGGLLAAFLESKKAEAKPATLVVWGQVIRELQNHFGKECPLRKIGRAEAEVFRQYLIGRGLAATTIHKRLQFTRQFFSHAKDMDWIERNPFKGITHKSGNPRDRQHYITVKDTERLIEAAPSWVWRTIIALARYGGLRSPSEVLSLPLDNLDWEHDSIRIVVPKTEHHGQGTRTIPMFAQLRPHLEEAWEMAEEGQTHVIPEDLYLPAAHGPRGWNNCNLRTTFQKIVLRTGLDPWPRLFHNLRASCESDLAREYPITTVCRWIGNSVAIAARHYIQVTDADFRNAAKGGKKALQNPVQQRSAKARNKPQSTKMGGIVPTGENRRKVPPCKALRVVANPCDKSFDGKCLRQVEAAGIEPNSVSTSTATTSVDSPEGGGAKCGAFGAILGAIDADPQAVVDAWPGLSNSDRRAVMAIVERSKRR